MELSDYRKKLDGLVAEKKILKKNIEKDQKLFDTLDIELNNTIKARAILQEAAEQTEQLIEKQINILVSSALSAIFRKSAYKFIAKFIKKRNKTECVLSLQDNNGNIYDKPVDSCGGGALDVVSFALRIAFWCIHKNNNVIILDEPFKNLSSNLLPRAGKLLEKLSEKLNLQFIIITHLDELIPYGKNIIRVKGQGVIEYK